MEVSGDKQDWGDGWTGGGARSFQSDRNRVSCAQGSQGAGTHIRTADASFRTDWREGGKSWGGSACARKEEKRSSPRSLSPHTLS